MTVLAIIMTTIALWCAVDVASSIRLVRRGRMESDFIAVYVRFAIVAIIASIALWIGAAS